MSVVGVDGCKAGWFAVKLDHGELWEIDVFKDIEDLWKRWYYATCIMVDIPIGLPHSGNPLRRCDSEARCVLGPRKFSVFTPPCRAALAPNNHGQATQVNLAALGRGLPIQTFSIGKKIQQVDSLLTTNQDARARIREIHPEVCFGAFAGCTPMNYHKATLPGYEERRTVLRNINQERTDAIIDCALERFCRKQVAKDDILDALAAAYTADAGPGWLARLPAQAQIDNHGLPMEMWYRTDYMGPGNRHIAVQHQCRDRELL